MRAASSLDFPLGHQMILASAGSGKTHDLTTRFLTLMAAGVAPEKIIALTFSRKSAGEFFNRILRRLAEAAGSAQSAEALELAVQEQERVHQQHLGLDETEAAVRETLSQQRAQFLLVQLVRRLHRLTLGTMDRFFIRMARSFPLELGLSGEFSILDNPSELAAQQRIFHRIFQPKGSSQADQQEFIQAFQQATHGREEAGLVRNLNKFLKDCRGYYNEARQAIAWGQPKQIWPQGGAPRVPAQRLPDAAQSALDWLEEGKHALSDDQAEVLRVYLEAMLEHGPLQTMDKPVGAIARKLAEAHADLQAGGTRIALAGSRVAVDALGCQHLLDVLDAQVAADFAAGCQQMQGVWRILHRYDQYYETMVRQQGQLTFGDVQQLLTGELAEIHAEDPQGLASQRELLAFRLDAQFDHWLLDEFQDTNGRQWRILEPLLDEVLQDDTGLRTFFAVGDVKQAIHMWRGSDPDLMRRIRERYNDDSEDMPVRIATLAKAVSWRCAPTVLGLANSVLGDQAALDHWLPEGTLTRGWEFEQHQAAAKNAHLSGNADVLIATLENGEKVTAEAKAERCYEVIAAKICEEQPLARGLSCVVLVLTNAQAREVAEALRGLTKMKVSCETETEVVNGDTATSGLLELLRLAAHPGNTFARQHLEMSPWREVAVVRCKCEAASAIPIAASEVRRQAVHEGRAAVVRDWSAALRAEFPALPAFSRERLADLASIAATFDQAGRRDLDAFIQLAEEHTMRQASLPQSIQVMTIFKAKGLEWDVVYFTGLDSRGKDDTYGLSYDDERHLQWITKLPIKALAMLNPTISEMYLRAERWRWRQNICLLYVALTRAKRATHVVLPQPPKTSTAMNLATLLLHVLPDDDVRSVHWGEISAQRYWVAPGSLEDWYLEVPLRPEPLPVAAEGEPPPIKLRKVRLPRRRPSDLPVQNFFSRDRHYAMSVGTAVHSLAAQVTWLEDVTQAGLTEWARKLPTALRAPAVRQMNISLKLPEVMACFTRPAEPVELWRERAFALVHDGETLSGTFDRVVVLSDSTGVVTGARLLEFKTDHVRSAADQASLVKRYSPQIQQYRTALAKLLGITEWSVTAELVFLTKGVVVAIS
jgi:ATP-dependent helicase/nuclease subunit A